MLLLLQVNGIMPKDLTTQNVDLSPQTNYSDGQSRVVGYTYTLTYNVNINNATGDFVSGIVDAIVRVGGNAVQLNGIQVGQLLAFRASMHLLYTRPKLCK